MVQNLSCFSTHSCRSEVQKGSELPSSEGPPQHASEGPPQQQGKLVPCNSCRVEYMNVSLNPKWSRTLVVSVLVVLLILVDVRFKRAQSCHLLKDPLNMPASKENLRHCNPETPGRTHFSGRGGA
ncbi:hypothetical protein CDAR_544981 [Caerostris darwini]|uniref:Uncharacterized protein n=1 Tax=Caerostris darwini TaxID=1538125 RepID=A0AAV4PWK3_9ARAC|nr:hypothetical protein CDAR_544981 [Caerostris darwini]